MSFGRQFAEHDWSACALGAAEYWDDSIKRAIHKNLQCTQAAFIAVGDHLTLVFNEAMSKVLGERWPEVLGRPLREVLAPIWHQWGPLIERAGTGECFLEQNVPMRSWQSNYTDTVFFTIAAIPMTGPDGSVFAIGFVCRETTQTVNAQSYISSSHRIVLDLLDKSPSFAAASMGPEHILTYGNEAFWRIVMKSPAYGVSCATMFPHIEAQGLISLMDDVYSSQIPYINDSLCVSLGNQQDGSKEILSVIIEPILDDRNECLGIFVQGENLTSRERLLEESKRLRLSLIEAGRTASLGALGSIVAHELSQPLAATSNLAASGRRNLEAGNISSALLNLKDIENECLRAGKIIKGVKDLVSSRKTSLEFCGLGSIIESVMDLSVLGYSMPDVRLGSSLHEYCIFGDKMQLSQLFMNLIRNSCEAVSHKSGRINVNAQVSEGHLIVEVADDGPGFQSSSSPLAWPIETSKTHGTGLGLTICRAIAMAHNASICLGHSELGGALVRVIFPPESIARAALQQGVWSNAKMVEAPV